jgi:predicted nucleic acid-binding protein
MIIVDTSVWIDYLGGFETPQARWLEQALDTQRLGLTDLILAELLQGIRDENRFNEVYHEMLEFEIFPLGGVKLAVQSARNFRRLRARGYTVRKTIDCLIASFCLENSHQLLHNDSDFLPFEQALGLQVIHP